MLDGVVSDYIEFRGRDDSVVIGSAERPIAIRGAATLQVTFANVLVFFVCLVVQMRESFLAMLLSRDE